MQIKEIIKKKPIFCTLDSSVLHAARLMVENDCDCLPVVENPFTTTPVGMITERDITVFTLRGDKNSFQSKVSDIMTQEINTMPHDTEIDVCGRIMKLKHLDHVLVLDEKGSCCGILDRGVIDRGEPVFFRRDESTQTAASRNMKINTDCEKQGMSIPHLYIPLLSGKAMSSGGNRWEILMHGM